MARKQIKVRILGSSKTRSGSISRRLMFIWFMLAGSILYLTPQNYSNKLQLAFAHIFSFPLSMSGDVSLSVRTQQQYDDVVPQEQYEELQNLYANLDQMLKKQREEFDRLYGLYNSYIGENVNFILGNIIPAAADRLHSELTINCRGTTGLEKGQFVMARTNSIIGKITDISPQLGKAKVRLITDPDSKIAVRIEGLDKKLQMQGNDDGTARIGTISQEQTIKPGQKVFALEQTGFHDVPMLEQTGFLDAPMIVGTVSKCKPDDKAPLLLEITVQPAWELKQLDEVAIIIMKPPKSK